MTKSRFAVVSLGLLAAAVLAAQAPAAKKASDKSEECMKHSKEMSESCEKMMASQKAMKEKRETAWKEIQAQLETAKNSTGEKKVAALESAVEKLVAFHGAAQRSMGEGMACCAEMDHEKGAMANHHAGMGHEMGKMAGHGMMEDCPCCKGGMGASASK